MYLSHSVWHVRPLSLETNRECGLQPPTRATGKGRKGNSNYRAVQEGHSKSCLTYIG